MLRSSRTIGVREASELRELSRYVARLQRQWIEPFGLGGRHCEEREKVEERRQ